MFLDPYLYLYACGSFSNGVFISLRGPVIPELARRVGKPSAALGAYLGIGGLSGGVFALPTGAMLDRYDAHAVFAFGTLLRAVSVGATPLCSALWHVNLLAVVQGATLPLIGVSIRVCLVRAVGQARCAQALNFTMGAFGLASVVTPLAYAGLQRAFGPNGGSSAFSSSSRSRTPRSRSRRSPGSKPHRRSRMTRVPKEHTQRRKNTRMRHRAATTTRSSRVAARTISASRRRNFRLADGISRVRPRDPRRRVARRASARRDATRR